MSEQMDLPLEHSLPVYSIFDSIDGEINPYHAGCLTTFIRLAGCNLRCSYCDTKKSQPEDSGQWMTISEIVEKATISDPFKVTITGGEPLLQKDLPLLLEHLDRMAIRVTIETNGSLPVTSQLRKFGRHFTYIMDQKLPSSGEYHPEHEKNLLTLNERDWVKFVVGTQEDFALACATIRDLRHKMQFCPGFAFSPLHGQLDPATLVQWMREEFCCRRAVLSLQLHKIIWPDAKTEV